jgi:hypothetical protein
MATKQNLHREFYFKLVSASLTYREVGYQECLGNMKAVLETCEKLMKQEQMLEFRNAFQEYSFYASTRTKMPYDIVAENFRNMGTYCFGSFLKEVNATIEFAEYCAELGKMNEAVQLLTRLRTTFERPKLLIKARRNSYNVPKKVALSQIALVDSVLERLEATMKKPMQKNGEI